MFNAYMEEYKHNACFLKTKQTFTICTKENVIKLQNVCNPFYRCLLWNEYFLFNVFINHFLRIHRSVLLKITIGLLYFRDIYDVNLWERLTITVRLCYIETRLKQGYDLRDCFLKKQRKMINLLTVVAIHCFS